jgi:hypothetical protein
MGCLTKDWAKYKRRKAAKVLDRIAQAPLAPSERLKQWLAGSRP